MNTILINDEISQFLEVAKHQFGHCEWNTCIQDTEKFSDLEECISKGQRSTDENLRELASLEVGYYEIKLSEDRLGKAVFHITGKTRTGDVVDLGETLMQPRLDIIHNVYDLLKSMQIALFHHIQMEQLSITEPY